jgi:hypothetical protein
MKQDTSTWAPFARIGYEQGYPVGRNVGWQRASQPGASAQFAGQPNSDPATYGYSMPQPYAPPADVSLSPLRGTDNRGIENRDYVGTGWQQWRDAWSRGFIDGYMEAYQQYFSQGSGGPQYTPPSGATPFEPSKPVPSGTGATPWPIQIPKPVKPMPFQPGKYPSFDTGGGAGAGGGYKIPIPGGATEMKPLDPGFRYADPTPDFSSAPEQDQQTEPSKSEPGSSKALIWVGVAGALALAGYFVLRDEPASPNPVRAKKPKLTKQMEQDAIKLWRAVADPHEDGEQFEISLLDNGRVEIRGRIYNGSFNTQLVGWDSAGPYLLNGGSKWRFEESERRAAGRLYRELSEWERRNR